MKDLELLVIGYLDGSLTESEQTYIESRLEQSEVQLLLQQHQALDALLDVVAKQESATSARFSSQVVNRLEQTGSRNKWRLSMEGRKLFDYRAGIVLAATACVTLVVASRTEVEGPTSQMVASENSEMMEVVRACPLHDISGRLEQIEEEQLNFRCVQKTETMEEIAVQKKAIEKRLEDFEAQQLASGKEAYGDLAKAFRADVDSGKATARELDARFERMANEERSFQAQSSETMEVVATQLRDIRERTHFENKEAFENASNRLGSIAAAPAASAPDVLGYKLPKQSQSWQRGETYANYIENPRILVATEPRSTFSIDVDTGSYTNSRRYLAMGQLPPANAVRIEEFINYFDYQYPQQSKDPFAVHYEIAPSPLEPERFLLKVGVAARSAVNTEQPRNLVFLVDTSGSMAEELPLLQQSLGVLTDNLRSTDRVAIVAYAGGVGEVLRSTPGSNKAEIRQAINGLTSGGGTYGSGGIMMAYDIAQKNFIADGVNRVILATDGDFNVGVTSFDDLVRLVEEKRKTGVSLTTIGIGSGNYQEKNLEQLANKGNGNYFYLDSFKEARKVFADQLGATLETVAKDVKLQIEFNPAHVVQYRLVGYDNRLLKNEDFANDNIDAGEIGAGHTVTAFYELVLADSELATSLKNELRYAANKQEAAKVNSDAKELGFLQIRFKQPMGDVSDLRTFPIEKSQVLKSASAASEDFRFAAAVTYFATKLRQSQFAGSYGFADILNLAKGAKGEDRSGLRAEFIELVANAKIASGERTCS